MTPVRLPIATEYTVDRVVNVYENGDRDVMPWSMHDLMRLPLVFERRPEELTKEGKP